MKKSGFTLIELLVVVAVIAVLLAIMMPSLVAAKEQARSVYCRNNLNQMCIAAAAYTVDNHDYFPIAQYTMTFSQALIPENPPEDQTLSLSSPDETETVTYSYAWDFTSIKSSRGTEVVPGVLWQGDTNSNIQQCPSYKGGDNWIDSPYTGYNYNTSYIGHGQGEWTAPGYTGKVIPHPAWPDIYTIVLPARTGDVQNPNQCVLFGDGHYAGGANKFMRAPEVWLGDKSTGLKTGGTQGFRHRNRTNVIFGDGHAETQDSVFTEINGKHNKQLEEYNQVNEMKIGFISSTNNLYDLK